MPSAPMHSSHCRTMSLGVPICTSQGSTPPWLGAGMQWLTDQAHAARAVLHVRGQGGGEGLGAQSGPPGTCCRVAGDWVTQAAGGTSTLPPPLGGGHGGTLGARCCPSGMLQAHLRVQGLCAAPEPALARSLSSRGGREGSKGAVGTSQGCASHPPPCTGRASILAMISVCWCSGWGRRRGSPMGDPVPSGRPTLPVPSSGSPPGGAVLPAPRVGTGTGAWQSLCWGL